MRCPGSLQRDRLVVLIRRSRGKNHATGVQDLCYPLPLLHTDSGRGDRAMPDVVTERAVTRQCVLSATDGPSPGPPRSGGPRSLRR